MRYKSKYVQFEYCTNFQQKFPMPWPWQKQQNKTAISRVEKRALVSEFIMSVCPLRLF